MWFSYNLIYASINYYCLCALFFFSFVHRLQISIMSKIYVLSLLYAVLGLELFSYFN